LKLSCVSNLVSNLFTLGASLIEYPSIILCNSSQLSKFRTLISSSDISIEERATKASSDGVAVMKSDDTVPKTVAFDDSLFCFLPQKEEDNESDEDDEDDGTEMNLSSLLSGGKTIENSKDVEIAEKAYEEFIQALTDLQNTDLASLKAIIEETGNLKDGEAVDDDVDEDSEEGKEGAGIVNDSHEIMET
jgi:hypothetical protein